MNHVLDITLADVPALNPDPTSPPDHTQQLINHLRRGADWYMLWTPNGGEHGDKKRSAYYPTTEPVRMPKAWESQRNVYFGVHPASVRREAWQATTNATIGAVNALYAEFDGKDFAEPSPTVIQTHYEALRADPANVSKKEKALFNEALRDAQDAEFLTDPAHYKRLALAHINALAPAPSVLWDSGGGYQGVWLLATTFQINTEPDRAHIKDVQARWVTFVGGDAGAHDLRRTLRLPGPRNYKKKYAPDYPLVAFVKTDFDLLYTLDELSEVLPAPEPAPAPRPPQAPTASVQRAQVQYQGDSVIDAYNAANSITAALRAAGYCYHTSAGNVERWRWTSTGSGASVDVHLDTNSSYHWSARDPLHGPATPFTVFCQNDHNGDVKAAVKAAAAALGMIRQRPDVTPILDDLQMGIKTHDVASLLPEGPGSKKVRPVVDAVFVRMKKQNSLSIVVGKRLLGGEAGVSPNTVKNVLALVNGRVFDVTPTEYGYEITLVSKCRLQEFDPLLSSSLTLPIGGQKTENDKNEYSTHKADDAFLTGTSRHMKDFIQKKSIELTIWHEGELIQEVPPAQVRTKYTQPGLGDGVLLAKDTSLRIGDMTAEGYAEATGLKLAAARAHLRRAETMGLATAEREGSRGPKVYSFAPDFWQRIDQMAPNLRTYKMSSQRENKRLEAAQQWAHRGETLATTPEEKQTCARRFAKLAKQRLPHLASLHPDLSPKARERLAYEVEAYKRPPEIARAKVQRFQATARLDVAEQRRYAQRALTNEILRLRNEGTGKRDAIHMLQIAGYTKNEMWTAVNQVYRKRQQHDFAGGAGVI